jgi:hypothetical protein
MFKERDDSWHLKKLAPIPNLKMFKERNDSWYVLFKKTSTNP